MPRLCGHGTEQCPCEWGDSGNDLCRGGGSPHYPVGAKGLLWVWGGLFLFSQVMKLPPSKPTPLGLRRLLVTSELKPR